MAENQLGASGNVGVGVTDSGSGNSNSNQTSAVADALTSFTSRKFLLTAFVIGICCIFVFIGKLDANTYMQTAIMVLGTYFGGSVADKKLNPNQQ